MKIHGVPIYHYFDSINDFKHQIELFDIDTEMPKYEKWLYKNIGVKDDKWTSSYWYFYFKDIEDAMAFKLRWA